jgi:hypothetical protein
MVWMLATVGLIGFAASYRCGAFALALLAFLVFVGGLLIGVWAELPLWQNAGRAFLLSATLQLSYLAGLLLASLWKPVAGRSKQDSARPASSEPAGAGARPVEA